MHREFGRFCHKRRIELGMTLREFCRNAGFDPSYWSKIERGKAAVPVSIVATAQRVLKLRGKDARQFKDLAWLSRGEVPPDLLSDEELCKILPVFVCGVRDPEKLKKLAEILRKG